MGPESEEEARAFVADRCCSSHTLASIDRFTDELRTAAASQNLVARDTLPIMWRRHVADSAQLVDHVPHDATPWLDLGSGAGFPGLVIAIIHPQREVILVESRRLRIAWLQHVIELLRLANCRVAGTHLNGVETFPARVISARAFAPLPRILAQSARFSTSETHWVLPKGRSAEQELLALPAASKSMFHVKPSLIEPQAGIIVGRGQAEPSP